MLRRPASPRITWRRVQKYFLCYRRHQRLWRQYNRVFRRGWGGDFPDGPATQKHFVQNSITSVSNCVRPVSRVVTCVYIDRNIALCVTRDLFV